MNYSLTDLPNIGSAIATDLERIGIADSSGIENGDPLVIFKDLRNVMGKRHDPCVYYVLLSVKHFLRSGESLPWWKFTAQGKFDLVMDSKL